MPRLEVRFSSSYHTFLGSLCGALRGLGGGLEEGFLVSGGTGFAFRLNIHPRLERSLYAFPWGDELGYAINRLGYSYRSLRSSVHLPVYSDYLEQAHRLIQGGIDQGYASIVWHLQGPTFGLVVGYDRGRRVYFTSGVEGELEVSFDRLGEGEVYPSLAVYQPRSRIKDFACWEAVRSVLYYAVQHAEGPTRMLRGYGVGLEAYDVWGKALEAEGVLVSDAAFMAEAVASSREEAHRYLERMLEYLPGDLGARLVELYGQLAGCLREVAEVFRESGDEFPSEVSFLRGKLREAKELERQAIGVCRQILGEEG